MELKLVRNEFSENTTIGNLFINGQPECKILEDKDRGLKQSMSKEEIEKIKVYGETCIPYTDVNPYEVDLTFSNKFQILMPSVVPVPGYLGIRIHTGATKLSSLGCLITALRTAIDKVVAGTSTPAFYALLEKMVAYKVDSLDLARKIIDLHKAKKSKECQGLYDKNKNNKKMFLSIEKDQNCIYHNI